MASNPPPYPPPGPPYGNDWKYQRRMMKEQARVQRDMLRAQAAALRYRARAARRGSIIGPIIVIAIGIVFLLVQMGRLDSRQVWDWYGHWWPVLLIGAGIVMFLEWAVDQYILSDPNQPVYRRRMGGGVFSLLLLLILVGIVFSGLRRGNGPFFGHGFIFNQNDLDQFLGDKHESDQIIVQAFPSGASFSVDNPRGDVFISGTSDDKQVHVALDADFQHQRSRLGWQIFGSSVAGGAATVSLIAISVPVLLAAAPVIVASAGGILGARALHGRVVTRAQLALEQLLDKLERGELARRGPESLLGAIVAAATSMPPRRF